MLMTTQLAPPSFKKICNDNNNNMVELFSGESKDDPYINGKYYVLVLKTTSGRKAIWNFR